MKKIFILPLCYFAVTSFSSSYAANLKYFCSNDTIPELGQIKILENFFIEINTDNKIGYLYSESNTETKVELACTDHLYKKDDFICISKESDIKLNGNILTFDVGFENLVFFPCSKED